MDKTTLGAAAILGIRFDQYPSGGKHGLTLLSRQIENQRISLPTSELANYYEFGNALTYDLYKIQLVSYLLASSFLCLLIMHRRLGTIFYLGYLVFEFPQNLCLQRFPVGKWMRCVHQLSFPSPRLESLEV